ncbi:hypothetical protein MUG94_16510 [Arthrobacter gengyunqii]|uniref:Uncharacterized protein n=1 Tax=Arthrobacter gengyunqii TaxID=2886940 RepID=A0A9X1M112_9MICC|nr:hypothetical protein [Arthrobacter gengyunqii]MCC3266002.1 hypothetical protein [Arthrobacter gengyunqii]MCC3268717.1 hypothetical protein [Arthrobacter gengyunqii]UOY96102.1 hypothetical protein MUG94_16510 [Arthrobacter gengyunqii]
MTIPRSPQGQGGPPRIDLKRTLILLAVAFVISSLLIMLFPGLGTFWRLLIILGLFLVVFPFLERRRRGR